MTDTTPDATNGVTADEARRQDGGHGKHTSTNLSPPWAGVPSLSAQVPVAGVLNADQQPSLIWTIMVGVINARIYLNSALTPDMLSSVEEHPLLVRFRDLENRLTASIKHYREQYTGPKTIGAPPVEVAEPPATVDKIEDLGREIQQFFGQLESRAAAAVGMQPLSPPEGKVIGPPVKSLDEYNALFRIIPLPQVAHTFQTDETFARYRVAGPDPMVIEAVTKKTLIHLIGNRISDEQFNASLGTEGDSVEKAGDDGRLCVANYAMMSGLDPVVAVGTKFITDPVAVFAEPVSGSEHIKPVAIQLGQDPIHSEVIFPTTNDYYRWLMAKTVVQVADCCHHELVAHLAQTHLVMETFSVATQRRLEEDHPLHRLLMPHFEGTNFINNGAATGLIAEDGPIDAIFANDRDSRLKSLQALAVRARFDFDFAKRAPRVELKSRGMDKLKVFPYRDDAYLLWDAIKCWAHDYVNLYYEDDEAVSNDASLAAWSLDISVNGNLQNFEPPKNKSVLTYTLTLIMYISSAQHAAVNFPQLDDMIYAPAMTGAAWREMPPAGKDTATEQDWFNTLPPVYIAQEQIQTLYLLGSVHYRRLGEYHSNRFPYLGTLEPKAEGILEKFRNELKAIEVIINRRNEHRGSFAYEFMLPSGMPASINI